MRIKAAVRGGLILAGSAFARPRGFQALMYHSIVAGQTRDPRQLTVPLALLKRQLEYLRENGYVAPDAASLLAETRRGVETDRRSVLLTFDDGYEDVRLVLPLLRDLGFHATLFVVADALTGRARPDSKVAYLDKAMAREMLQSGVIAFGAHSSTHRNLRAVTGSELIEETAGAKARIEDAVGVAVRLFAYPYGSYDAWDPRVRDAVASAGFDGAFTSIYGANDAKRDPFLLRRSRVSWAEELPAFARLMNGGYDWLAGVQWLQARRAPGVVAEPAR